MTKVYLDPELVLEIYKRFFDEGRPSLAQVARELDALGIRTREGKGPSRQAVHYSLRNTEEGRELLKVVADRRRL